MVTAHRTKAAELRSRVTHPIIDADGHTIEFLPAVLDYVREIGSAELAERYRQQATAAVVPPPQERLERRLPQGAFWGSPANTLDRATAGLPRLLYRRLPELGIDFAIVYPSSGLTAPCNPDEEIRRVVTRAVNKYHADIFREYADRIIPVAALPMHTPQEAIDELEYVTGVLELKAISIPPPWSGPSPPFTGSAHRLSL